MFDGIVIPLGMGNRAGERRDWGDGGLDTEMLSLSPCSLTLATSLGNDYDPPHPAYLHSSAFIPGEPSPAITESSPISCPFRELSTVESL